MRWSLWKVKAHPRPHSSWTRQGAQILSALAPLTQIWPSSGIWELTFCSFMYTVLLFSKQEFQNKVSYAFSFSFLIVTFKKRLSHITILEGQRLSTFFSLQLYFGLITIFGVFSAYLSPPWHLSSPTAEDGYSAGDKGRDPCTPFGESVYRHLWLAAYQRLCLGC